MRTYRLLTLAALATAILAPAFALNNADVIKMKKADFSDDTIMLSIAKQPAEYDTSPDGLIALKQAGISEAVIQKMLAAQNSAAAPAPVAAPAPDAAPASNFAN